MNGHLKTVVRTLGVFALLYVFFVSIQLMGDSFKTWKAFSKALIEQAENPFVGLFIGILATSMIQSSSTTTSMVVGFVASGVMPVPIAVPIIMGANIGTSVTNTLVSLGHIGRKDEFQRALACATVHDFFNIMAVVLLLPAELLTRWLFGRGILEWSATGIATYIGELGGLKLTSPLKAITKPATQFIKEGLLEPAVSSEVAVAVLGLIVSGVLLFLSLWGIVRLMRLMVLSRVEYFFERFVGAHAVVAMLLGLIITVSVQSSSITTSLLVPLAGAGVLRLAQAFPITLGANVGTTITAMLASLAAGGTEEAQLAAVSIALVHLLFNLSGILLVYPAPAIRQIPLRLSEALARRCVDRRWTAVVYVFGVFFVIPGLLIAAYRLFS
jgi:sodium-dependent phosphate cotransporter